MVADTLNALGYADVEPMAPGGGSDGGRDIKFREGTDQGVALSTLEKKIVNKFSRDLAKQGSDTILLALFCNVNVTPAQKLELSKRASETGRSLIIFDLERLRSLLDSSLTVIRRRYLGIDDEVATRLRSDIRKLLRFPSAFGVVTSSPTVTETLLSDQIPRRLFELIMTYEERDVREVPGIGPMLHDFLTAYYRFREATLARESQLLARIGKIVAVRFVEAWKIYLRYSITRFAGASQEQIIEWGDFLNYSITWNMAEQVFQELKADVVLAAEMRGMFESYQALRDRVAQFSSEDKSNH
jgi:alkylhydroperoxidase/carboxymuconolactone decarboxylase family protein YurZ/uncharacterized protein YheU (UPF0270 family)